VIAGVTGIVGIAILGIVYLGFLISKASLLLSAAVASRDATMEGAQHTVQTVGPGASATIQAAHRIADAIVATIKAAGNAASRVLKREQTRSLMACTQCED